MTTGYIFNIQRFSTHDGPGIRTTVFLKGCPLICAWCSNPESQLRKPQLMIRDIKCTGCGKCIEVCPENALYFEKGKTIRQIDWGLCAQCFKCVDACLFKSLTVIGEEVTSEHVLDIVEKDRVFYKNSGGGVTFSGGECLSQPAFLEKMMVLAREKQLHVTLDTTGFAPSDILKNLVSLADLVLFDVKHLNPERHKELTGVDNALILKNLRIVAKTTRTWLRVPLISGVNDSDDHIEQLTDMASELNVDKISFLPFHEGGISKTGQVGMDRPPFYGNPPTDERIEHLSAIANRKGLKVTVGS